MKYTGPEPFASWERQEEWKRLAEEFGSSMAPHLDEATIAEACWEDCLTREEVYNLHEHRHGVEFAATVLPNPTVEQVLVARAWWGMLLAERAHSIAKFVGYAEENS